MKPKVLINIDTYAIGGPGRLILQFLENGGMDSCEPLVAGFWRGPDGDWQFRDAVLAAGARFEVLRQAFAYDPLVIGEAYRLARGSGIQILESHGYKSHVVCLALRRLLGIPWVAYVHGWTSENFKVGLYNRLDRFIVRFADRIVPVSRDLGEQLRLGGRDRDKLVNIPNAVSPARPGMRDPGMRESLGVREGETLLAVVGRMSPEKGHVGFIEAFRAVLESRPGVKAVFVGDGQERGAIEAAILRYGLEDRVTLAGYREDVSPYYLACDAVVLPSLREGMPMAALEAMSYARPVVATRVGGIPEVVLDGTTGILVEPENPAALAGAIAGLLGDAERMNSLGLAGRELALTEFSPNVRSTRITELYGTLLKDRKRN